MDANKAKIKQTHPKEKKNMKTLLTIKDVSEKLHMSISTIYKYAEQGKIPSFKIGTCRRFFEEEINNYVLALSKTEETKHYNLTENT
jgi:PTS system nitrogen regulatory IIA component